MRLHFPGLHSTSTCTLFTFVLIKFMCCTFQVDPFRTMHEERAHIICTTIEGCRSQEAAVQDGRCAAREGPREEEEEDEEDLNQPFGALTLSLKLFTPRRLPSGPMQH